MRSQLRFIMHPDDETAFLDEVLRDPTVVLIDGPRWKTATPHTARSICNIRGYCIIWSPADLPALSADYIPQQNDWYCRSEFATIQFLRCSITDRILSDGRIAVSTQGAPELTARAVERRYKQMSKAIKRSFLNSVVQWQNINVPVSPAGPNRSANPSKPDTALWVGPMAMKWLLADKTRCIKQVPEGNVEGRLIAARSS